MEYIVRSACISSDGDANSTWEDEISGTRANPENKFKSDSFI